MKTFDVFMPAAAGEALGHYKPLLEKAGVTNKSLIKLDGKPMINHVIEAVENSQYIRSITVLGLTEDDINVSTKVPMYFLKGGNSSYDTINIAITHFNNMAEPPDYIMNVSSDIPLITGIMIDRMVETMEFFPELELYFNISSAELTKKWFPEAHKVPIKLREGHIYGGDIHIMKPSVLDGRREALQQFMGQRKSVWSAIKVVSFRYIFKYILRRLTVDDIRKRFKKLYDLDAGFVFTEFPDPCVDLDYENDLELFEQLIHKKRQDIGSEKAHTIKTSADLERILELTDPETLKVN